jgi:GT2 family glycosyltransferase
MKCDIIIPIWNQLDFTRECIEHILKNTKYPYRLILVDNASDEDTKKYLEGIKNKIAGTILVRNEENAGFIKAVNRGLRLSDSPYICIMNNDTLPAPGWLERMIGFSEAHPDAGLINPQCNGHGNMSIDEYSKALERNKGLYMEMNQCQGFCMLMKRRLMEKIGYLDESFGIGGYDDTDYSIRAHKAGFRSVSIRDAYVYHRLHASFDKSGDREEWVKRNREIYYRKWGKHLRIGIIFSPDSMDPGRMADLIKLSYGLAREWSWPQIWINSREDKSGIQKAIDKALSDNKLPPHQNIRIDYFNTSKILFYPALSGKIAGRAIKKMGDKRFDAIIFFDGKGPALLRWMAGLVNARVFELSGGGRDTDWEKKGKELAVSIRGNR